MYMKRIAMLTILIMMISNCTAFKISEQMERERGKVCTYDYKGNYKYCEYER